GQGEQPGGDRRGREGVRALRRRLGRLEEVGGGWPADEAAGANLPRPAPTCPNLPQPAPTCPNLPRPAPTCPNLPQPAPTCPNLPQPAPTCPNLPQPAPTCPNLPRPPQPPARFATNSHHSQRNGSLAPGEAISLHRVKSGLRSD